MLDRDPFFVALVGATATGLMAARVTLQIDGMIIGGKLISEQRYLEGIQDSFAQEGTHGTALFANAMEAWPKARTPTDEELAQIAVFFLEDVTVYAANQPSLWFNWWRGRVSAVTGWAWDAPRIIQIVTEDMDEATEEG